MKVLFWLAMLCVICGSCKKTDEVKDFDILTSHAWYLYKTEIVAVDTITITPNYYPATYTAATTINHTDTIIYADDCIQSSTITLQTTGKSHIDNPCNLLNPSIDTVWSNQDGNFYALTLNDTAVNNYYFSHYAFSGPAIGYVDSPYIYKRTQGHFILITNDEFVYNSNNAYAKLSISNTDSVTTTTTVIKEMTTYKRR